MHNAWMRATCGRMKSDYRYFKDIVYNNFPWLGYASKEAPAQSKQAQAAIKIAAQAVLDARAAEKGQSLADLYDPLAMPQTLRKARQKLDKVVDAAAKPRKSSPEEASAAGTRRD